MSFGNKKSSIATYLSLPLLDVLASVTTLYFKGSRVRIPKGALGFRTSPLMKRFQRLSIDISYSFKSSDGVDNKKKREGTYGSMYCTLLCSRSETLYYATN